jgi:dynein intermediate chain 2
MDIVHVYVKERNAFGKYAGDFRDKKASNMVEILPEEKVRSNYIERNPCSAEVLCAPDSSEHEVCNYLSYVCDCLCCCVCVLRELVV